jgi:hypothetical protein
MLPGDVKRHPFSSIIGLSVFPPKIPCPIKMRICLTAFYLIVYADAQSIGQPSDVAVKQLRLPSQTVAMRHAADYHRHSCFHY